MISFDTLPRSPRASLESDEFEKRGFLGRRVKDSRSMVALATPRLSSVRERLAKDRGSKRRQGSRVTSR